MTRYAWERKLRPALRGTRGYAVQQEAWDAVMPCWRRGLELINHHPHGVRYTETEKEEMAQLSAALRADNRRLAGPWFQLLMQDLYRSCPALGGWFPS